MHQGQATTRNLSCLALVHAAVPVTEAKILSATSLHHAETLGAGTLDAVGAANQQQRVYDSLSDSLAWCEQQ